MTERARERIRDEQQHGESDQLDPARDLDRRACSPAIAPIVAPPRTGWQLSAGLDYRARDAAPARHRMRRVRVRTGSQRREVQRLRARRRRARAPRRSLSPHLPSFAVLLLTLLLTAFGTWSSTPVATQPLADRQRARRRPAAAADRRHGGRAPPAAAGRAERGHRDRLPPGRRRLARAPPGRPPGERGPLRTALAPPRRLERGPPRLVPAAATAARARRRSRRRRTRHRRLLAGRRHRRRHLRLRALEPDRTAPGSTSGRSRRPPSSSRSRISAPTPR